MSTKILLVDDSRDIRALLSQFLNSEGFDVESAGNGREALERLERIFRDSPPDMILLDQIMDVMDGPSFLNTLERYYPELLDRVPIILMTAADAPYSDPRLADTIKKPFDIDIFLETVRSYVNPI